MGFKASDIPALDWDFRPYVDAHGITPEPTQDRADAFREALTEIADDNADLFGTDGRPDPAKVRGYYESRGGIRAANGEAAERALDIYSAVCDNCPTREQIASLPPGIRQAFYAEWNQKLLDPTRRISGTNT